MSRFSVRLCFVAVLCFCHHLAIHAQAAGDVNQSLPIVFESNRGQVSENYSYHFHRDGVDTLFSRNGMDVVLRANSEHPLHIEFAGGNADPQGMHSLTGHTNYLLGSDTSRWIRNVPLFSEIDYTELYRGVSLSFYGNDRELEHDFRVAPGSDPSQIVLRIKGTSGLSVQPGGDLAINSPSGTVIFRKPVAYQLSSNGKESVPATFRLSKNGDIRFDIGAYDHSRSLVIDPVIVFSTYLAGTGTDAIAAITTDASGNILVTGYTTSVDFPTKNPIQSALGNSGSSQDAFITKMDPTGKTLIYSTYLGGSSQDYGGAITVDSSGNVIIAGVSSSADFPSAGSISSATCQINDDCYFLASLKPDGSGLNYSGIIGGTQGDYTNGVNGRVAVDTAGNAYLAGITDSSTFYVTPGTLATTVTGYPYSEMFVLKVDPTGKLVYSTVVPGNAANDPLQSYNNAFLTTGISVDGAGNVTTAGWGGLGLPTTSGVVAPQFPNASVNVESPEAGFVLQLNPTATAINFASYLPGTDQAGGLAVDSSGNLWVAGLTSETNLPVSANAYQKAPSVAGNFGPQSGYIMKLAPKATSVLAATYLDGTGSGQSEESSNFTSIALDSKSNVFVGGMTSSADFPLQNPFVTTLEYGGSIDDMILAEMSPDLSTVEFGSFLSSTDASFGGSNFAGITIDAQDHLIAAGTTNSQDFPTTPGSFEPQLPPPASPFVAPLHSFITKIDLSTPAPAVCFNTLLVNFGNVNANASASKTIQVTNCGNASLNISTITSSDPTVTGTQSCGPIAAGAVCPIQLTFTPVSSASTNGTITLSDNAVTLPQTVSFLGQGIAPRIVPNANPLPFGHLLVGTQGPVVSLLVSNQGQAPLSISNVALTGSSFSLVGQGCTKYSVLRGGTCLIQLSFTPLSAGDLTGSLTITSNDPVTPQLIVALNGTSDSSYAVPSIASINFPTVLINNGPVTETITGTNFYPQSVVQLNGASLATTFTSNTLLNAIIPASALTSLGEEKLVVVNPGPGGGSSPAAIVTPYQTLLINPAFLVSVPATGLLYAAIPSDATINPNTVIPIDPTTGAMQTPIPVGKNPAILAASSDGTYLYVANQTDETVQRINLKTNAIERTFPYTPNLYCSSCSNLAATDLATIPGSPQEVLLSQGSWLSLFNDAGLVNYVPNDGICCEADPDFGSIALAGNPLTVYGVPFSVGADYFQMANLTSSGLTYTRTPAVNTGGNNTTGNQVISDGTLLYTSAGQIWNPATQSEVGTFPVTTFNATSYPNEHSINLDASLGEIYSIGTGQLNDEDSDAVILSAYGMQSHALNGTLVFPQLFSAIENNLVRWGTNGLAFIAPGTNLTNQEVYLVRSSVVSPTASNPAPVLSTITPASVVAGGSSFVLTVNGSDFVANSVIHWNGTALDTTFVGDQQLTAMVPASNIAQAGTAQITVFTPAPGGGTSVSASLTISPANPVAKLSASTLSFGSTTQSVSSSAQTVTLTNSGNATLTLSSITVTGDFSVTNTCGSSLTSGSSCNIAVVFTPSAAGARTGTLNVADNAPNSPQTVALTGTGLAAMTLAAAQGGATSATVASGGVATYNLSIAGGTGFSGTANLACTGAPQYSSCAVTPSSAALSGGTATTFTVTVKTGTTQTATEMSHRNLVLAGFCMTPLFGLCWLLRRKHRLFGLCGLCVAMVILASGVSGCAGSGGGGSTQQGTTSNTSSGTYTLTITATSGSITAMQNLSLTVN
jgi:hypothetical protein